jgi:hypothetical protein
MIRNRIKPVVGLFSLALGLAVLSVDGPVAAAPPPDGFVCSAAQRSPGSARPASSGVALADQFGAGATTVKQADRLCVPASVGAAPPSDPATWLVRRNARTAGRTAKVRGVRIDNALGAHDLDLARPSAVLLPTAIDGNATPAPLDFASHGVDRYRCWNARAAGSPSSFAPAGTVIEMADLLRGVRQYEIHRPKRLCVATDMDGVEKKNARSHLACYDVRPAPAGRTRGSFIHDGLGAATLDTTAVKEVCLPSRAVWSCNGAPELCDRRYDEVSYATTHNAMSNAQDSFTLPNQQYDVTRQLEDGVRGLMLDTHDSAGVVSLCHALCQLGQRPLVDTLIEIREFLEREPYEVVSIIFESYVSAADTAAAFTAAGLDPYLHAQGVAAPWPTLREMIATDRRLVVFTDSGGGTFPWYHHVWNYAFETHYSFATPAQLSCAPNRGNPANRLFILNHFLTQAFGKPELAEQVNHNPLFIDRANQCAAANGALPNFVTVDFHDIGDTFAVVKALNGL